MKFIYKIFPRQTYTSTKLKIKCANKKNSVLLTHSALTKKMLMNDIDEIFYPKLNDKIVILDNYSNNYSGMIKELKNKGIKTIYADNISIGLYTQLCKDCFLSEISLITYSSDDFMIAARKELGTNDEK